MSRQKLIQQIIGMTLVALWMTGCGTGEATSTPASTPTKTPASTPTQTPTSTPTPMPEPVWSITTQESRALSICAMTLDLDENLWTTGERGVVRWELESGSYVTFGHEDGMPGYRGSDIITDLQGGIWVRWAHPTYKGYGVSRYLQGQWTHYSASDGLADDIVNDMAAAPDGKVWFSTPSGISCFDGDSWASYTHDDGLPSDTVGAIATGPDGIVWAHTDEGAASFDGMEWVAHDYSILKAVNVRDILVTQQGWVWFATSHHFVSYDGNEFKAYWPSDGARAYNAFEVTRDGTLWARAGRGIAAWRNGQWYIILEEYGLGTYGANGFLATQDGALWLTTSRDGMIRLSDWRFSTSGEVRMITRRYCVSGIGGMLEEQFSTSDLESLSCLDEPGYLGDGVQMPDGRLIFASGKSITIMDAQDQYQSYSLPEVEPEPPLSIPAVWIPDEVDRAEQNKDAEDPRFENIVVVETGPDGRVWYGSEYGISVWDGNGWTHWPQEIGEEFNEPMQVNCIDFYGDDVWVADRSRGISKLVGGNLQNPEWVTIDMPYWDSEDMRPGFLHVDSQGGVWAAGKNSLPAYYDSASWKDHYEGDFEEVIVDVMVLAPDDSLWVGFRDDLGPNYYTSESDYEYYLMRFDGDQWQQLGQDGGLPQARIQQILIAPDERVWVGFWYHGVVRFDASGENWEAFNTSNVFANSDSVRSMFLDDAGTLWFQLGDGYACYGVPLQGAED